LGTKYKPKHKLQIDYSIEDQHHLTKIPPDMGNIHVNKKIAKALETGDYPER
jgi:hypothetical protein